MSVRVFCASTIVLIIILTVYVLRSQYTYRSFSSSEGMIAALPCIEKYQKRIEDFMSEDLAVATCKHPGLHRICKFATSGGKKKRSIILLCLCESESLAALAVE
jgi:hypothetical protein